MAGALECLTEREAAIAELVGQGLTNKEIGDRFVISVRTVDFHLRNVFKKLGVRSRTELAIQVTRAQMERQG